MKNLKTVICVTKKLVLEVTFICERQQDIGLEQKLLISILLQHSEEELGDCLFQLNNVLTHQHCFVEASSCILHNLITTPTIDTIFFFIVLSTTIFIFISNYLTAGSVSFCLFAFGSVFCCIQKLVVIFA